MPSRLPSAWTIVATALVLGCVMGTGAATLQAVGRPMRIGDFSGTRASGSLRDAGGPEAAVPVTEHAFGTMGTLESGTHRFVVTNRGDAPLTLRKGESSCGCTIAEFERQEIPPGESEAVAIEWRTKAMGGPFDQQVRVHTNDPRRPDISLRISGHVVPRFRVIPEVIAFPKLVGHGGDQASATLLTYGSPPRSIAGMSLVEAATADRFEFDATPLSAEELAATQDPDVTGGHTIVVTTKPGLPLGAVRQTLRIELVAPGGPDGGPTDEAAGPAANEPSAQDAMTVEIPIVGTVEGDISVAGKGWDSTSQTLALGTVSGRIGLRTDLFLTVKGPHREQVRPSVREVVPGSMVVDVGESKPVGSGSVRRIPVTIAIPPGSPTCHHLGNQQGPLGRIVLDTGHPEAPRFEIPVRVVVGP